uniref:G-protein coupled receptors family 2 profile 2 domain-containing protein n=1 Tax=Amphimedon queenslandica TaxID=400682 RepID=A0A1X7TF40_AMPQE
MIVLLIVFFVTSIFCASFTKASYKYDPYDSFDCFFTSNDTLVETRPEEALRLEDKVVCFQFHLNIAEAMGQASGTLAFLWILSSIMTWTSIALKKKLKKANEEKDTKNHHCYCTLLILYYLPTTSLSLGLIAAGLFGFTHRYSNLLGAFEIMTCGFVMELQLLFLIISDIINCYNRCPTMIRHQSLREKPAGENDKLIKTI